MNIELKCSKCGHLKTVQPIELTRQNPCIVCGGQKFKLTNPKKVISEAIEMDLDKQLQRDINKLGLERVIEVVNQHVHLRKCYGHRINKRFGREIIK